MTLSAISRAVSPVKEPRPRLRGWIHACAAVASLPAAALLIIRTHGVGRVAVAFYVLVLTAAYAVSSAYHCHPWTPSARSAMRRLDHCMIHVLIAGTATPVFALGLDGLLRVIALAGVWCGAGMGIALKLGRLPPGTRLGGAFYVVFGWVAGAPLISLAVPRPVLILLVVGGLIYTIGALALARRWPDPLPAVFGYHEVWHAAVVVASSCHYAAITLLVGAAPSA